MTLHKVTQEDAGDYRCEISASLDSVVLGEANVTLKVLGASFCPHLFLRSIYICMSFICHHLRYLL